MKAKVPHPLSHLIKAWADGETIQARRKNPEDDYVSDWMDLTNPIWDAYFHYDFRIKPAPPTLGEIARVAYARAFGSQTGDCGDCWSITAEAVKKAIEAGEYSE